MADYTISKAMYAKGQMVVRCKSDGSGYKTRTMSIAESVGGRWVHRSAGYNMSPRQAQRFEARMRELDHVDNFK